MPIDTEIQGQPAAVRGAAGWARSRLGVQVSSAADTLYGTRNLAASGWVGEAGEAFGTRMSSGAQDADGLAATAEAAAGGLDTVAAELERAQEAMTAIRARAAAAGLTFSGTVIADPGPAPLDPGPAPSGDSAGPASDGSWAVAAAAADAYGLKVAAYDAALADAVTQRQAVTTAAEQLRTGASGMRGQASLFLLNFPVAGAAGRINYSSSVLYRKGQSTWVEVRRLLDEPPATTTAARAAVIDDAVRLTNEASDNVRASGAVDQAGKTMALKAGGVLAVAGIAYDVIANDKPVTQAIVSGGSGFGASVLAGAAIGSVIPVPVVGTALGIVGGAAVGVFTSGMMDTLYTDGFGSPLDAASDGWNAVRDTTSAIGDLAGSAWDALF